MKERKRTNKKYSPEFKLSVIPDMRNNNLGYNETMRKYNINSHIAIPNWERKYLEEGRFGKRKSWSSYNKRQKAEIISELRQKYPLKNLLVLSKLLRSTYYYYLKQSKNVDKYLSPIMALYNREIISYSISKSPKFWQTQEMLQGLFEKLPQGTTPLLHSDQGWQYQMREFQHLLAEHNIRQSMSRKDNCLDNSCMENFFGRLKTEMFYGETFQSTDEFIRTLEEYLWYYNNERISLKLKGMSSVQYRTHSQI